MKKLFLVAVLFLFSCEEADLKQESSNITYTSTGKNIREFKYDGCEYIGYLCGSNGDWGTHKGNCSNPIHVYNK